LSIVKTKFEGSCHASGPSVPLGTAWLGDRVATAGLDEGIEVAFGDVAGLAAGWAVVDGETQPASANTAAMTAGAGLALRVHRLSMVSLLVLADSAVVLWIRHEDRHCDAGQSGMDEWTLT
jgi:hypothetical protein